MNRIKTLLLLGLVTALVVAFGSRIGTGWLIAAIVAAFALTLAAYSPSSGLRKGFKQWNR